MFSSHQVMRRYTPPTCTLEIYVKNSPLKRWQNQNHLKSFQFQLSFDDPRLPTEKQITIHGDREQLEQFYEIVNHYLQAFLQLSLIKNYSSQNLLKREKYNSETHYNQPDLQTQKVVNHELHLGCLNQQNLPQIIKLNSSQLFDLVTALEEYQADKSTSPQLLNNHRNQKKILFWGSIAATVLTLGGSAIGFKLYLSKQQSNVTSQTKPEPTIINPKINDVVPPQVTETDKKVAVQPKLNEPLSSTEKLPPPPPVDLPKPPPDIPDPAKFPEPEANTFTIPQPAPPTTVAVKPESDRKPTTTIQPESVPKPSSPTQKSSANSEQNKQPKTNNQPENFDLSTPRSVPSFSSKPEPNKIATNSEIAKQTNQTSIPESPQVKEIQKYFQTKWQTPPGLEQTLEYRLIINPNGSIKRIVPLGKASQIYLDRTNIPLMGEPFVSPLAKQEDATVRLLLSPDGAVKTFLE